MQVVIEPMRGNLLGEVRGEPPVIALRAGTSSAQRRCTLAHEIVHLERGVSECGPWQAREEHRVHLEAARRLIPSDALRAAIRDLGGSDDLAALAGLLEVDMDTIRLRIRSLSPAEDAMIRTSLADVAGELWAVA
ncbi:MAG TPA: ImmA/IrrE family metallo-endopeptidase [Jatrophihabitantaceae bacterium]|nr:ImmA/IrrE family metallo-endopeptidase [Jatrophihabitantaceae bacterium]